MTIEERLDRLTERHEALTMNLELSAREIESLRTLAQQDGENIRALAHVAELQNQRITRLEDRQ
jgi:hypothetical protein